MGVEGEFIGSPRLDDLQCAYGTLMGFLASEKGKEDRAAAGEYGAVYALLIMRKSEAAPSRGLIPPSCPIS